MLSEMFSFLQISPDGKPLTDTQEIRKNYAYWRIRVMYAMIIGYVGFYFVRVSISAATPVIIEEFGFSKAHMGLIITIAGLIYGLSKFINGFVGDRTNPRYFMAFGLICSAAMNVFFGLSSGLVTFGIFWILNGWFQGMGWAPCTRTLVNWYSAKERGLKFAIANTAVSIGAALVMFLNGYLVKYHGWRYCFFVPAGIAFIAALLVLNRLRDRPQSLGLPPVEVYKGEEADIEDTEAGKTASYKQIIAQYIFKNPMMWVVCLANLFVYIIRYVILDWGTTFLTEARGIDIMEASWIVGGYEMAGLAGMLIGGFAMDKLFKGYGGRTCAVYMALCTLFIFLFWKLPVQSVTGNGLLLLATGFFIYGPQCLVAVIAANMVPKQAGAAAVGITGLFGYLSKGLSGFGLGILVDNYGWDVGFLMLVFISAIGMLLFVVLWNSNPHLPGTKAYLKHNNKDTKYPNT